MLKKCQQTLSKRAHYAEIQDYALVILKVFYSRRLDPRPDRYPQTELYQPITIFSSDSFSFCIW